LQATTSGVSFSDRFLDIVVIEDASLWKPDAQDNTLLQTLMPGSLLASLFLKTSV